MNPQINVEEITQNILIVLAIQNTILAQIRLTIYKIVIMSFDGYGLWDITDFATDLFVALLKKSNTTVCHLSYFPEKRHCTQSIPVSIRPPFPSNLCNKHSSEHTHIMASWV